MDEHLHQIDSVVGSAYFEAMNFMAQYALDNRMAMMDEIADVFGIIPESTQLINENHNFASIEPDGILHRKGATPAELGKFGVIPGNMRDGTYITKGLGNKEFLCCASHGAGRRMSRGAARRTLDQSEFERQMSGVSCETEKRLDESPGAYKDINEVTKAQDGILVDVIDHITPRIVIKG
jgi:tRNA-splicing ligase RtcB